MQKKLSFLLAVLLVFTCLLTACAPDDEQLDTENFSDATFNYVSYDDGWGISGVDGLELEEITIPAEIKGRPVVRIEMGAFANNTVVTKVTIPDSVKYVGDSAFEGCTALSTVNLPDSVELVGTAAFTDTAYSNTADNWDGEVLYLGNHLIDAKRTIKDEYDVKSGTLTIACHAFADRDDYFGYMGCTLLTAVSFPSSLKVIGDGAFKNCTALAEFEIFDSITYLGDYAFQNTAYFNSMVNDEKNETEVFFLGKHLIQAQEAYLPAEYTVPDGTITIASPAFADCEGLTKVVIPEGVTHIGIGAFRNCTGLVSIVFKGTAEDWEKISKGYGWNQNTGACEITFEKVAEPVTEE